MTITANDLAELLRDARDFEQFKDRVAKLVKLKEREQKEEDQFFDWHGEQDSCGQA